MFKSAIAYSYIHNFASNFPQNQSKISNFCLKNAQISFKKAYQKAILNAEEGVRTLVGTKPTGIFSKKLPKPVPFDHSGTSA